MADTHTKLQRSKNMAAIRSKGNKTTEIALLNMFKEHSVKGWRRHYKIANARPDFVFTKERVAVFVDGCFWHGCPQCYKEPKTNKKYWKQKVLNNRKRDRKNDHKLQASGWKPIHIWEHSIKKRPGFVMGKIKKLVA